MCKCVACLLKFILVIVALLMMIVGIVLTVVGAFLMWGLETLLKNIAPVMTNLNDLLKNIGVEKDAQSIVNIVASNAVAIGAVAFVIGVVLLIVSILLIVAMCCCSTKVLFIVIIVLLSAIVIGLVVVLAFYASEPEERIFKPMQSYFQNSIINKYEGLEAQNPESVLVNILHIRLQCCGLTDFADFNTATSFKRSGKLKTGQEYTNLAYPISCCNYNVNFIIAPDDLTKCLNNELPNRKNIGCWSKLRSQMDPYSKYLFIALGVTIAVLVAVIIVLIFFICCMDKFE